MDFLREYLILASFFEPLCMRKIFHWLFLILVAALMMLSCKREADNFVIAPAAEYYPLQVGKYVIYQLDSTVFTNFETTKEIHSYQVKDLVDAEITDNLGRPAYRIRRMIRDSAGLNPWADLTTFMVTPLINSIEFVENNLRFIKLVSPVRENYFWNGNSYINSGGELDYLSTWEYSYSNAGQPYAVGSQTVDNTVTVLHSDETMGDPVLQPNNVASKNYSVEVYGKNVGLIFKDFIYWFYQKNNTLGNCRVVVSGMPDTPCPYDVNCDSLASAMGGFMRCDTIASRFSYDGYGIRLTMKEHN